MKLRNLTSAAALALLALSPLTANAKPKYDKKDLTPFKGSYSGSFLLGFSGSSYPGSATVNVSVPKSGKSAIVTVSGLIAPDGTTLNLGTTLGLDGHGSISVSNIFVGFPEGSPTSATGSYVRTGPNTIAIFASAIYSGNVPLVLNGTMTHPGRRTRPR